MSGLQSTSSVAYQINQLGRGLPASRSEQPARLRFAPCPRPTRQEAGPPGRRQDFIRPEDASAANFIPVQAHCRRLPHSRGA